MEEQEAAQEIRSALSELEKSKDSLELELRRFSLQSVDAAYKNVSTLADLRARTLAQIPRSARASLSGFTSDTLQAIQLEAELIALGARAQPILHADKINRAPSYLKDIATPGENFLGAHKNRIGRSFGLLG